eukprot:14225953-Alexandrium_andersonii.AAC.1
MQRQRPKRTDHGEGPRPAPGSQALTNGRGSEQGAEGAPRMTILGRIQRWRGGKPSVTLIWP